MSDSSNSSIDSFIENDCELESDLLNSFNNLSISSRNTLLNNIELNNSINNLNMPNTIPVFDIKNLSIVPDFDGNPNKLHRFIQSAEALLLHYFDTNNLANFQNTLLLNGILNKLHGRAEEIVAIHGATSNWHDIKNALLLHFGDQRDENCLNQDLVNLRQNNGETPKEFHEKIMSLLNTICNYIDLKCDAALRPSKREFFTKQALKTFLAGLKEPLGPIIRAMRPQSLAQALQFIIEEDNIKHYQKSGTIVNNVKKSTVENRPFNNSHANASRFQNQNNMFQNQLLNHNQFPSAPIHLNRYSNYREPKYFTNSQVFGRPQAARPTPMSISTNQTSQRPTPMSISTNKTVPKFQSSNIRNTNRNYFPDKNAQPRQNFVSEELFNTENYEEEIPPEFSENLGEPFPTEYSLDDNEENFQPDLLQDQNT